MGNGTEQLHPHRPRRRVAHVPWAAMAVIAGLLLAAMAVASLELRPEGGARTALWVVAALGGGLALGGTAALAWGRLRSRRGLHLSAGGGRRWLWPATLALLALAILSAVLPIPYPSPWLSLVPPLLFLAGAAILIVRILSDATPLTYHRALRAYREGDAQRALALVRQAVVQRPDGASRGAYGVHYLEAILLRESGALSEAREVADRLVAWRPDLYYGHAEQGLTLLAAGDAATACEALERAVERAPRLAEAHYNLGMARAEAGDAAGAVEALECALRLGLSDEVTHLIARYQLYRAYSDAGLAREAADMVRWLRRRRGAVRRWRETVAADLSAPRARRRRDEAMIADIERAIAGENRNAAAK